MSQQNKKVLKVKFNINLTHLVAEYKSAFTFKLTLKRGEHQAESVKQYKYSIGSGRVDIPLIENFHLETGFVISTVNGNEEIEEKILKYYLLVLTSNGFKPASNGEVDLSKLNLEEENNLTLEFRKHSLKFLNLKISIIPSDLNLVDYDETELYEELVNLNYNNTLGNTMKSNNNLNVSNISLMSTNTVFANQTKLGPNLYGNSNNNPMMVKNINVNNNTISKPVLIKTNTSNTTSTTNATPNTTISNNNNSNVNPPQQINHTKTISKEDLSKEISKALDKQKQEYQSQLQKLDKLDILEKENNEITEKYNSFKQDYNILSSKNKELNEENSSLKQENKSLEQKLELSLQEKSSISNNNKTQEDLVKQHKEQLISITKENERSETEKNNSIKKLESHINVLSDKLEKLENEIEETKHHNQEKTNIIEDLESQNSVLMEKVREAESELKQAQLSHLTMKNDYEEEKNKNYELKMQLNSNSSESNNKQSKTEELMNERIDDLLRDIASKNEIIEELKDSNERSNNENYELNEIIKQLKQEKTKLYDEKINSIKQIKEELNLILVRKNELENESSSNQNQINLLHKENTELKDQTSLLKEKLEKKEDEIKQLQYRIEEEESIKNSFKIKNNELEEKGEKAKIEISTLKNKNNELNIDIENLKESFNEKIESLKNKNTLASNNETLQLQNDIEVLENDNNELTTQLLNLKEEIDTLKKNNFEINDKNESLINKNELLIQENQNYVNKLNEIEKEIDTLYKENKKLSTNTSSLNDDKEDYIKNMSMLEKKYKEEVVYFKETLNTKSKEILELNTLVESKTFEIEKLKRENETINENTNEQVVNELEMIKDRYEIKEKEIMAENEMMIEQYKERIEELENHISKDNSKDLQIAINKLTSENKLLNKQITELHGEMDEVKMINNEFLHKEELVTQLQKEVNAYRNENSDYKMKISVLEEENQRKNFSVKENENIVENLQKELVSKSEFIAEMLNELSEVKGELEKKQIEIDGISGEKKKKNLLGFFNKK